MTRNDRRVYARAVNRANALIIAVAYPLTIAAVLANLPL